MSQCGPHSHEEQVVTLACVGANVPATHQERQYLRPVKPPHERRPLADPRRLGRCLLYQRVTQARPAVTVQLINLGVV